MGPAVRIIKILLVLELMVAALILVELDRELQLVNLVNLLEYCIQEEAKVAIIHKVVCQKIHLLMKLVELLELNHLQTVEVVVEVQITIILIMQLQEAQV